MIPADSCNVTSSSASVITHSQSQIKAFPSTDEQKKIVPDERLTHTGNHKSQISREMEQKSASSGLL